MHPWAAEELQMLIERFNLNLFPVRNNAQLPAANVVAIFNDVPSIDKVLPNMILNLRSNRDTPQPIELL